MNLYFRYTANAADDLVRGTSYHRICLAGEEEQYMSDDIYNCFPSAYDLVQIGDDMCQKIGGLCGYWMEAETLEEALTEVQQSPDRFPLEHPATSDWAIFEAEDTTLIDGGPGGGDVFKPIRVLYTCIH